MVQDILVWLIVFLAFLYLGRRIYRGIKGKAIDCGCRSGDNCAACPAGRKTMESCCVTFGRRGDESRDRYGGNEKDHQDARNGG